jgi:hypothetical protein
MNWMQKIAQEPLQPYPYMKEPNNSELATEFEEEIASAFQDNSYLKRWPGLQQRPQCFMSVQNFVASVYNTQPTILNEQQLMQVHNYAQVEQSIQERMKGNQNTSQVNEQFFENLPAGDIGEIEQKRQQTEGRSKADSYRHKVNLVSTGQPISYPILININGKLCHVTGQTRQSAAVANGYMLPVKILT